MKVMSFNVKHISIEDIFFIWKKRYRRVAQFIRNEDPDVLGMQEITKKGKKFLSNYLPEYNIVGESRHSGFFTDEYNPILIKKKYKITSYKTYSLSDNIEKLGTKTKQDNFPRICVVVHMETKKERYVLINTHIDNSDFENRKRLLNILEKIIVKENNDNELIVIMGDYNMTIGNKNLAAFSKKYLNPFKDYTESTFPELSHLKPLDHIFLDKRLDFSDDKIHKNSNDRGFLSDHNPISCCIKLKKD